MSEARTDTTQARPQDAGRAATAAGAGRHRGPAASEDTEASPNGRHRRDQQPQDA
ncbi:hypothetical protein [Streptomyces paromomycinus]|uniref:Uncharacterized protein n=1 Tax=Streptomyces paromomycinus TaxID=92743 RepID=A0A401WAD2_STREY|nr:hypothetical protein [Streptomyces paromomycinus]GCD46252.1 hypothetical protein GKJPGBOP_05999 [Streptomyces paromomycinus]